MGSWASRQGCYALGGSHATHPCFVIRVDWHATTGAATGLGPAFYEGLHVATTCMRALGVLGLRAVDAVADQLMILARSWHIFAALGYDNIRAQGFLLQLPSASFQPSISAPTDMRVATTM
eukprot:353572-Chlamydomonas_euryale.AAC.8